MATVDPEEVLLFHPDPDLIAGYQMGMHDYETVEAAKRAYARGELSHIELRAVLDDLLTVENETFL